MERPRRLTTPRLEEHGRIGPFFYREAWLILTFTLSSWGLLMVLGSFIYIPPLTFLSVIGSLLMAIGVVRLFFIKTIDTPWYIFFWIAKRFTSPRRIEAHLFPLEEEKLVFRKKRAS